MSSALGLTSTRGDEITVTQILFQDPFPDVAEPASWLSGDWPVADMVQFFLLTVVVIAISIMVYKVSKNFNVQYDPLLDGPSDAKPSELNGSRGNNMIGNTTSGLGHDGQEEDLYVKKLSDGARKKITNHREPDKRN